MAAAAALIAVLLVAAPAQTAARHQFEYVHGRELHFVGVERLGRLQQPLFAPLLGHDVPLAIPSPTRGRLLYHAWDGTVLGAGVPVLRLYDREGGPERVVARGAQSAAWRRDGALAYRASDRSTHDHLAVVPAESPVRRRHIARDRGLPPVRWTREQTRRYIGFATCDGFSGRCARGADLRPAIRWAAVIANPSRPR